MIRLEQYVDDHGRNVFDDWLMKLDESVRRRVLTALVRLEAGNTSNLKSLGQGVLEAKLNFGPGYRIYLGRKDENWIILLCGGSKQRQSDDIYRAHAIWKDYMASQGGHR